MIKGTFPTDVEYLFHEHIPNKPDMNYINWSLTGRWCIGFLSGMPCRKKSYIITDMFMTCSGE